MDSIDNPVLENPSCTVSARPLVRAHAVHTLFIVRFTGIKTFQSSFTFFLEVHNSTHFYSQGKRCSREDMLLQGKDKDMPMASSPDVKWKLPTGFSIMISWLSLSCSQVICAEQQRHVLRSTVMWITNSLMYNTLPVRITTPAVTPDCSKTKHWESKQWRIKGKTNYTDKFNRKDWNHLFPFSKDLSTGVYILLTTHFLSVTCCYGLTQQAAGHHKTICSPAPQDSPHPTERGKNLKKAINSWVEIKTA